MKLYYAPNTRAVRPHWMLEELEIPYVLERLDFSKGQHKSLDYMKIHPHGAVPALVDGSVAMFESAAIVMYLADKYPEKGLAPAPGSPDRGAYYQWILYVMTSLEPPLLQVFLHTLVLPEDKRSPVLVGEARSRAGLCLKVLEEAVKGREYIVGKDFTGADLMVASMLAWGSVLGILAAYPQLTAYVTRLTSRPAFKRMQERESERL
jgi:glutathione S-transferase